MSIQHASIPDAQLHESKGVASALANKIYYTNGSGSGSWEYPNAHGNTYFVNLATPSILVTPTVYTKSAPTTTIGGTPIEATEATTARVTYTGAKTRFGRIEANFTADQTSGAARVLNAAIYKNGVIIASSEIQQAITTTDKINIPLMANLAIITSDYFEVYIKITGTGNVQVYSLNIVLNAGL